MAQQRRPFRWGRSAWPPASHENCPFFFVVASGVWHFFYVHVIIWLPRARSAILNNEEQKLSDARLDFH